jgi:hypothetical protein
MVLFSLVHLNPWAFGTAAFAVLAFVVDFVRRQGFLRPGPQQEFPIHRLLESREVPIAIIDDELDERFPEPVKDTLKALGFNVDYFEDIYQIDQLSRFPVVLCDVRLVGKHLSLSNDPHGGILVREIRKFYPMKYLVMYTSALLGQEYNEFRRDADAVWRWSDMQGDELANRLDSVMSTITSPDEQWGRLIKYVLPKAGGMSNNSIENKLNKLHNKFDKMTPNKLPYLDRCIDFSGQLSAPSQGAETSELLALIGRASDAVSKILAMR